MIGALGRWAIQKARSFSYAMGFFFQVLSETALFMRRRQAGFRVLVLQILFTGVEALSIVALVALAIGAVIIVEGGTILPRFGQTSLMYSILIIVITLLAFLIRLVQPLGTSVMNMQLGYFSSYIVLFVAGLLAGRTDLLASIPSKVGRAWLWASIGVGLPLWMAVLWFGGALTGQGHRHQADDKGIYRYAQQGTPRSKAVRGGTRGSPSHYAVALHLEHRDAVDDEGEGARVRTLPLAHDDVVRGSKGLIAHGGFQPQERILAKLAGQEPGLGLCPALNPVVPTTARRPASRQIARW